jgi:heme/copper-type cytochrome/quinol oxidase subunit 4
MPRLALLAPLGSLLFTAAWLVLGAISPGYRLFDLVIEPYSPISQPVSGLGLGVTGPWMNAAFVIGGLLLIAGALGVRRAMPRTRLATAGLVLSAFAGVGMVIDGIFTLESVMLHLLGFLLAVPLAAVGFVLLGVATRGDSGRLAAALVLAGVATVALFVWFMAIFDPYTAGANTGYAGLVQRILITVVLAAWTMLGVTAWRRRALPRSREHVAGRRRAG